jgi:hypothetical protein
MGTGPGGDRSSTIDAVLDEMDAEIARCRTHTDRRGYFAAVYRAVTARVRDGVAAGEFADNDVLEHLDVVFARRYLDACDGWWGHTKITEPWDAAFQSSLDDRLLVLQHLLLGMNAHINLDLGIATAETADDNEMDSIDALRGDFEAINGVLASLIDRMQDSLATVSPWIGLVDRVSRRLDEGVSGFAIEVARDEAWRFAVELAALPPAERPPVVDARARAIADLAHHIARPPWPIRMAAWVARLRETDDLDRVMGALDIELDAPSGASPS